MAKKLNAIKIYQFAESGNTVASVFANNHNCVPRNWPASQHGSPIP